LPDVDIDAFMRLIRRAQIPKINLAVSNSQATGRDSIFSDGSTTSSGETDYVIRGGVAILSSLYGAVLPGTPDTDVISCSPSWGSEGTIVQAVMPYGWSGGAGVLGVGTRLFELAAPIMNTQTFSTTIQVLGNSFATGGVTDSQLDIIAGDWNGTLHGGRLNTETRKTNSDTDIPSGNLSLGNRAAGDRPFHGAIVTLIFDWVLSDAEYEVLRVGLNRIFGNLTLT
jgi:hypothetical protein